MSGRTIGMPRIEHPDAPSQEKAEEQLSLLQFATVQQVTVLQNQISTIMEMLQRMTAPLHVSKATPAEEAPLAAEVPPAVEVPPSEATHMHEMTSTSRHSIPANWKSILSGKVEEAIVRRNCRGRPISIKEDLFTKDVMNVPLQLKFKETTGNFDGTTDPIDHIQTFKARVRLHGWPDAIACRAFFMTLQKDAREWFDTLPPWSVSSFADFTNKFTICFSSSMPKKKTAMGLMQVTQDKGETLCEYMSRFNCATLGIKNLKKPSVITVLLSGNRNHDFRASLSKKSLESMTELLRRGEEYIDQEEVLKATRGDRESYDSGNKKRQRDEPMMSKPNTRFMSAYKYRPRTEVINAISHIQLNVLIKHFRKEK
ncbi:Uncharacterized protein Adt_13588 [Abeliophyllum distichum]|uniref:Retrotransposon gag domain-containing protein n=1 Tax=Abeliophyllum distichum TaxID=126358 RepID=A0ABD1TX97_9LAMI